MGFEFDTSGSEWVWFWCTGTNDGSDNHFNGVNYIININYMGQYTKFLLFFIYVLKIYK